MDDVEEEPAMSIEMQLFDDDISPNQSDMGDEEAILESIRIKKLKKRLNGEAWTDQKEDIIKSLGEKAGSYRELHLFSADKWRTLSDRLTIPTIVLSTISSVSAFGSVNVTDYMYWMYAAGTINLVAAFLTSLGKYYKPDERVEKHIVSAKAFGKFYRHVVQELSNTREDRQHVDILSKWSKTEFDRLMLESPIIKRKILEEYKVNHSCDAIPDLTVNNLNIQVQGRQI
jgi:hypothetical protein